MSMAITGLRFKRYEDGSFSKSGLVGAEKIQAMNDACKSTIDPEYPVAVYCDKCKSYMEWNGTGWKCPHCASEVSWDAAERHFEAENKAWMDKVLGEPVVSYDD